MGYANVCVIRFGVECEEVLSENVLTSEAIEASRSL